MSKKHETTRHAIFDEMKMHEKEVEKKARAFFKEGIKIHVNFKENGEWENGWIAKDPDPTYFILKLTEEGAIKNNTDSIVCFNILVRSINPYQQENSHITKEVKNV